MISSQGLLLADIAGHIVATSASAVHPFFKPPDPSLSTAFVRLPSSPTLEHYVYLDPFDTEATSTCSPSPVKIALCDLDGCLIKTKGNSSFPKNRDDWEWWHPGVKRKLKEWQETGSVKISNTSQSFSFFM